MYAIRNLLERTEVGEYGEAVEAAREVGSLLPGLAGLMKQYLKWLDTLLERRKREADRDSKEFQALASQIKAKIHVLMEARQYQAALGVAEQIHVLLPGDEEIGRLRERLGAICARLQEEGS